MSETGPRRGIPAVENLLQALEDCPLPRPVLTAIVRREVASLRASSDPPPPFEEVARAIREKAADFHASRIQPVINGTGVLIHTNLGRAPLGEGVADALRTAACQYNNLEFDLLSGERGDRAGFLEHNLAILCEAEAATVVNNCASALVLILRHFTGGERNEVVISRGELIEIGGGFRIPDILETSGARLREVGTTNRTTLDDYRSAIGPRTAMLLKVHRSNFFMGGFVAAPSPRELHALAGEHDIPFVEDLGSGAVAHTDTLAPIDHEPTPAETLRDGAELICFSGDKLLGGPQAGIIAGNAGHVSGLKKNPFFRALRCDRLVLAALQETVTAYLHAGENASASPMEIPVLALLREPVGELEKRAHRLVERLAEHDLSLEATVGSGKSRLGGGTMPTSSIPSATIDLLPNSMSLTKLARRLRQGTPPVIGYTAGKVLKLDMRTVIPSQDDELARRLVEALG